MYRDIFNLVSIRKFFVPKNPNSEKEDSNAAKLGLWSAIAVAVIGAVTSISVVTIDKVIAPQITQEDVVETVKSNAPRTQFFEPLYSDGSISQNLVGDWQICSLMTSGTVHHNQACTCRIEKRAESDWLLHLELDDNVNGRFCRCQAACFDFGTISN